MPLERERGRDGPALPGGQPQVGSELWARSTTGQPCCLGFLFYFFSRRKLSSPHLLPPLKSLPTLCLSLPRKKLPLHNLVHRRHLPPCDLGDSLCLLETVQKVWVTLQVPLPEHLNPSTHPSPKLCSFLRLFKRLSSQGPAPLPRISILPLHVLYMEPHFVLTTLTAPAR